MARVRLGDFANLVGMHRDAVLSMLKTKRAPFRTPQTDGQRTYSGAEVLAMHLHRRIDIHRGERAARQIVRSGVVETALSLIESGEGLGNLALCVPEPVTQEGRMVIIPHPFAAPMREVCDFLRWQVGDDVPDPMIYGRPTPRTGLHSATIVPVAEAYRAAQEAAAAGGFRMIGRALLPTGPAE